MYTLYNISKPVIAILFLKNFVLSQSADNCPVFAALPDGAAKQLPGCAEIYYLAARSEQLDAVLRLPCPAFHSLTPT